jgi:hypothetical protein
MGQRLIVFGGALLVVGLLALPGAAIGGLTWLAFPHWARPAAAVPAALICSMVILGEVFLLVEALGPAYDRLDLACIEPADT